MLSILLAACASTWPPPDLGSRYDVVVLGKGLKESLLAGLLAKHGRSVLQLDAEAEGSGPASLDLQQLAALGDGNVPPESKVGKPGDYSIERAPKMFIASGDQLQMLVNSGAWQHMSPPGFKRVHRSLMYRKRPDGNPDVHRVLANSEDVVKTRTLSALEKAKVVQFFLWIERYNEDDVKTHATGPLSKVSLNLHKISASKFLTYWELPKTATAMVVRGMALHDAPLKRLKKMPAIELVRKLKRYKDAYRTFPHMTSPYVYPVGGFGNRLAKSSAKVIEANGGCSATGVGSAEPLFEASGDDLSAGSTECVGVTAGGVTVHADCVVGSPSSLPSHVTPSYQIVRLYAVLAHPPNLCKESSSCQLILPGEHAGRASEIYLSSFSSTHGVAPKGKWVVVASARVEGSTDGLEALAIAKRELSAVLPLLKPSRKLVAEVTPYCEADPKLEAERLIVFSSCDESSYLDSVEVEVAEAFERITGEDVSSLRGR